MIFSFGIIVNIVMLLIIENKELKNYLLLSFIQYTKYIKQIHQFVVALSFFYDVGSFFQLKII